MTDLYIPDSVREIADVIGLDKALDLIAASPRTPSRSYRVCLYVPKDRLPVDHWLVRVLGWEDAQRLSRAFSGMVLQPSNCAVIERQYRNQQIVRMDADGIPWAEIAAVTELSRYRVGEIIRAAK